MDNVTIPSGNTPIWQLTVDQFRLLMETTIRKSVDTNTKEKEKTPKRYVHGVIGIKQLFNCSYPTAHKLKETIIKPAVHQQGRVIIVDVDLAIKLFKEHEQVSSVRSLEG